jgi:hypothetical protein
MLIIIDKQTKKETQKIITDHVFGLHSLNENQEQHYISNESPLAKKILSKLTYDFVFDGEGKITDITNTKTQDEYMAEIQQTTEYKRQKILSELEQSDKQLFRLIDDLTEFCETLGYKPAKVRKDIINNRKALRQQLQELGN